MLKVIVSLAVALSCFGVFPEGNCEGGCQADIGVSGTFPSNLQVTLPQVLPGTCVKCPGCGECEASPCTFTGEFKLKCTNWVDSTPIWLKINGARGYLAVNNLNSFTVSFNGGVGCGDGVTVSDISYEGVSYTGVIKCRCTPCPLTDG